QGSGPPIPAEEFAGATGVRGNHSTGAAHGFAYRVGEDFLYRGVQHHVGGRECSNDALNIEQPGKTNRQAELGRECPQARIPRTVAANHINQFQPIPVELAESFDGDLVSFVSLELGGGHDDRSIRRYVPLAAKRGSFRWRTRKPNGVVPIWNVEPGPPSNPGLLAKGVVLNETRLEGESADSSQVKPIGQVRPRGTIVQIVSVYDPRRVEQSGPCGQ